MGCSPFFLAARGWLRPMCLRGREPGWRCQVFRRRSLRCFSMLRLLQLFYCRLRLRHAERLSSAAHASGKCSFGLLMVNHQTTS
jgi:hypothetical protein